MDEKRFWYCGVVTRVIDGDTVDADLDLGMNIHVKERIRLYGIDTPEIFGTPKESEEYKNGIKAKLFVEERLLHKKLWFHTHKDTKGKYGRYLADIFFQDDAGAHVCIGQLLLEEGLAKRYP